MKYAFIILWCVLLLSSFSLSAQTEKFSNYAFTHAAVSSYTSPFRINGMHENKHLKKTSVGNVIGQTLFWTSGLVLVLAEPATCLIENLSNRNSSFPVKHFWGIEGAALGTCTVGFFTLGFSVMHEENHPEKYRRRKSHK